MKTKIKKLLAITFFGCCILLKSQITMAQWQQTSLPSSNPVLSLTINGANIFAGTGGDGVIMSSDNGANWTNVSNGLTNLWVNSVVINGSNIFAGTAGDGVFMSTNNGTAWTSAGLAGKNVNYLSLINSELFAATTEDGVSVSSNNGITWTQQNTGLPDFLVISFAVKGTNIFAGTASNGIYLSTNNGLNWSAVNNGLTISAIHSFVVSGTNIFVGTESTGVFKSTNNGTVWTSVTNNLPTQAIIYSLGIIGTNIYAGTSWGIFLSTNNGSAWQDINEGLTPLGQFTNAMAKNSTYLFTGTNDKIWKRPISEITTVDEIKGDKENIVMLNANSNLIEFDFPGQNIALQCNIYSISGQLVYSGKLETTSRHIIRTNNLKSGMYFLNIVNHGTTFTKKFVTTD